MPSDLWILTASPNRRRRIWPVLAISTSLLLLFLLASLYACGSVLHRANSLGRRCVPEPGERTGGAGVKIAMVTFSDERRGVCSGGRRSFEGLMEAVWSNKIGYAKAWGYDFIDARDKVDRSRPPNWSKILAVRSHLPNYDWILWNDADSLVTNPDITLEGILQAVIGHMDFDASPDLIVTEDINGINSGMFFLRRSKWSQDFLDTWWNQTSFIRFGSTKSGDNAAMKHLIDGLPSGELQEHVRISPMQCLFNSYPWFPSWKTAYRLIHSPKTVWKGAYSRGDFMVHLAGLDDKKKWAVRILQQE